MLSATPLASVQSAGSRARTPACGCCGAPVGSLEAQLAVLAGRCSRIDVASYDFLRAGAGPTAARQDGPTLPALDDLPPSRGPGCLCSLGCGELYCDEGCEAAAVNRGAVPGLPPSPRPCLLVRG